MKVYFIDEQLIEIAPPLWTWITFYMMEKDYKRVAIGCVVFDNFSAIQPTKFSISLSECGDYQKDVSMCIMQPRIQWWQLFSCFQIGRGYLITRLNIFIMNVDMYDCLSYSTTGAWLYPSYPPPGPQWKEWGSSGPHPPWCGRSQSTSALRG